MDLRHSKRKPVYKVNLRVPFRPSIPAIEAIGAILRDIAYRFLHRPISHSRCKTHRFRNMDRYLGSSTFRFCGARYMASRAVSPILAKAGLGFRTVGVDISPHF